MIPVTLSASSLQVADGCLARWKAEYFDRGANIQGNAANVGIVCHGCLEDFLRGVFIRKDRAWSEGYFWECFHKNSDEILGPDRTTDLYKDAWDLAHRWYHTPGRKEDLEGVRILSLESKNSFPLKTTAGEIPINYIMDRLDQIGPNEYRVVDYKSNRVPLTNAQLRRKLQARLYALMVQIKYPKAERIWVQFEFLRHGQVEVLFTRDDNVVMFRELQRRAEDIIATPDDKAPETLNAECGWCVRKPSCKKLISHQNVGGILGMTPDEMAKVHYEISNQQKAQQQLLSEIEDRLLTYCVKEELTEFDTDYGHVQVELKSRRSVNNEAAAAILGPAGLASDYQTFSVTSIDQIVKKKLLPEPQLALLKMAVTRNASEPSVKVDHSGY